MAIAGADPDDPLRATLFSLSLPGAIEVVVGTNAGFLHMFDNADGEEDWAFFPKELAAVFDQRRDNLLAVEGWHTAYVGWADTISSPTAVCSVIEGIVARRALDLGVDLALVRQRR